MGYTVPNDLPRKGNERMVIPMKKMLAMLLAVLTGCAAKVQADDLMKGITPETVLGHHGVGIFWNVREWTLD